MTHDAAWERLPDLLADRDDRELLAHVNGCHACQQQLFRLGRVDRLLRLRGERRRRRTRWPLVSAVAAAAAAAAVAAAVHAHGGPAGAADRFTLATRDGAEVAVARVEPADDDNQVVSLVAHGLPARPADTYLLWTRSPDGSGRRLVGRFMVSHRGECRARFNLAGTRHSAEFWITPVTRPAAVVAST